MKNITLAAVAGLAVIAGSANGADIRFELIGQATAGGGVDFGSGPSAVAWDGTNAYVAGWNNSGGTQTTGLRTYFDVLGTQSVSAEYGIQSTSAFRGYLSVDVRNGQVLSSFENGTDAASLLGRYDGTTGALLDSRVERSIFANYDPAVVRSGEQSAGFIKFGSGRVRSTDPANYAGGLLYDGSNGAVIFNGSTIQRGFDIDTSGNIALGDADGNVSYFTRTGENGTTGTTILGTTTAVGRNPYGGNGVNVNILNTAFGDFVLWNDRGSADKSYGAALNVTATDGTAQTIEWVGIDDTFSPTTAWYDFDYDAASGTIAVSNFSTGVINIFAVTPAPAGAAVLGLGGLAAARRRR